MSLSRAGSIVTWGDVMVSDEDVCLHCGLCAERWNQYPPTDFLTD